MYEKIITIELKETFSTLSDFLKFVSQKLQTEIEKLPTFAKIKTYQEISLIELKEDHISYGIRFGEIIESEDREKSLLEKQMDNEKKKHPQSKKTREKIGAAIKKRRKT